MEDKKSTLPEEGNSEKDKQEDKDRQEDDEDLLYTHNPESRGNEMRWNNSLCRKSGR